MKKDIPVLLLTGYLGSGKTTVVNKILNNRKGIKFAVIVNDIGEVNIDADLIEKGGVVGQKDDSLVALQNGCICCTLKMDLIQQLHEIIVMQRFDYIVIEASGICEPEPIAQTICSFPDMAWQLTKDGIPILDCIVTVVDALRMQSEFGCGDDLMKKNLAEDDLESLVIQQIEFCNIILLNKASEVTPEELGRVKSIIRALQPTAEIITCDYGDVDFDKILNTKMFDFDKVATSATWIKEVEGAAVEEDEDDEHEHHHHDDDEEEHGHHHHHHDDDDDADEEEEHGHQTTRTNTSITTIITTMTMMTRKRKSTAITTIITTTTKAARWRNTASVPSYTTVASRSTWRVSMSLWRARCRRMSFV